ncbi:MAG: urease accessory UreF family protein [Nocardioides sp.]
MTYPELLALLLADARLPAAGHTQSGGLEPALLGGMAPSRVRDYMAARLETVTRVEAATAVVTRARLLGDKPLTPVLRAWSARTPSPAVRSNAHLQGRALLRLTRTLWPGHRQLSLDGPLTPRAMVLGAIAAVAGIDAAALTRVVAYDDLQTVASAALKLHPDDPARTTGWVHDCFPLVDLLTAEVATLTDPADIPCVGAPQFEVWAQAHATTPRRLFSA